jgi:hypothetical protein
MKYRACLGLLHSLFFNSAPFHTCQTLPTPAALLLKKIWSWGKLQKFGGATKQVLHRFLRPKFSWSWVEITHQYHWLHKNGLICFVLSFSPVTLTSERALSSPTVRPASLLHPGHGTLAAGAMDDHLELSGDLETQEMERFVDTLADTPVTAEEIEQEEADLGEAVDVAVRPAVLRVGLSRVGRGGGSASRGASLAGLGRGQEAGTAGLERAQVAGAVGLGRGQEAGAAGLGRA